MKEKYIGVVYIYLYNKLKEKVNCDRRIDRKTLIKILSSWYHFPRQVSKYIIEELVRMNLLKKVGKGKSFLQLEDINIDKILNNPSRVYNYIGVWN